LPNSIDEISHIALARDIDRLGKKPIRIAAEEIKRSFYALCAPRHKSDAAAAC
jgi:hypothetical protein